jgi:hypothetical protein
VCGKRGEGEFGWRFGDGHIGARAATERGFGVADTGNADGKAQTKRTGDGKVGEDRDVMLDIVEHGMTFGTQYKPAVSLCFPISGL